MSSVWPLCYSDLIGGVLQRWFPLEGYIFSSEEHWSSDIETIGLLVTSLTKAILPQSLSLDGWTALGRVLLVPNISQMMEVTVPNKTFKAADIFL